MFEAEFLRWAIDYPVAAPIAFIIGHTAAAMLLLPCSGFTVLAGLLWPLPFGLILSIIGTLTASSVTFFLGRRFRKSGWMPGRLRARLEPLHGVFRDKDWMWVLVATINPVVPSSALGYAFGLSPIPFRRYFWSTFVAMLPLQIAFVTFGGFARSLWSPHESDLFPLAAIAAGGMIAVVVAKLFARFKGRSREDYHE